MSTAAPPQTVGFVGLGDQGEPMAGRILAAGYRLVVYARRPDQAAALVAAGAERVDSLPALARDCDVIGICVGGDADVVDVFDGLAGDLRTGAVVVVHSTVHPQTCVELGRRAAAVGAAVLDAPVSGGRRRALEGRLTLMVGGEPEVFAAVRPILDACGDAVAHFGPLGSGQAVKLVNNYLLAAQVELTFQAAELVRRLGLDLRQTMAAVATSTGSSAYLQHFAEAGATVAFPGHPKGTAYGAALLGKDVRLMQAVREPFGGPPTNLDRCAAAGVALAVSVGQAEAVSVGRLT